jgi:hypothetical protein
LIRDFTVPSGSFNRSAISWYVHSWISRRQNRRAQRRREAIERRAHQPDAVARLQIGVDGARRRGRRERGGIDVVRDGLALRTNAAVIVDAEIAAHADEPCLEVGASIERVQRLEQLDEHVLREILSLFVAAGERVRHVEDHAPVQTNDFIPGSLIAAEAALDDGVDRERRR